MAALAFDTLAYVRRIIAAGVPREQAEAQADAMKEAFVHNVDALVTRDYLDTRFSEFETRVEANMDRRFTEMEARFTAMEVSVDKRFAEQDARFDARFTAMEFSVDKRFAEQDARIDARFSTIDLKFEGINGQFRLVFWMLAVSIASTVIPAIQQLYSVLWGA